MAAAGARMATKLVRAAPVEQGSWLRASSFTKQLFGYDSKMSTRASTLFGYTSRKMSTRASTLFGYTSRKMSSGSQPSAETLAEELIQVLKEPHSEEASAQMNKLAQGILKALKTPAEAEAPIVMSEAMLQGIRIGQLESNFSEMKASAKLTSTINFTFFGVIGCLIFAMPNAIHETSVKSANNAENCRDGKKASDKKYRKLKSRVEALERTNGLPAQEVESLEPVAEEMENPQAEELNWRAWLLKFLRKG